MPSLKTGYTWHNFTIKRFQPYSLKRCCMNHSLHITYGRLTPNAGYIWTTWIKSTSLKVHTAVKRLSRPVRAHTQRAGEASGLRPCSDSLTVGWEQTEYKLTQHPALHGPGWRIISYCVVESHRLQGSCRIKREKHLGIKARSRRNINRNNWISHGFYGLCSETQ